MAVAGPDRMEAGDCETQNGEAAISSSLPFEFVIFSKVNSRCSYQTHLDFSEGVRLSSRGDYLGKCTDTMRWCLILDSEK